MQPMFFVSLCLLSLWGTDVRGQIPDVAEREAIERRAHQLRPRTEEVRWMQIPWVRSLREAERLARHERRPLMYWHVDYDPLERC